MLWKTSSHGWVTYHQCYVNPYFFNEYTDLSNNNVHLYFETYLSLKPFCCSPCSTFAEPPGVSEPTPAFRVKQQHLFHTVSLWLIHKNSLALWVRVFSFSGLDDPIDVTLSGDPVTAPHLLDTLIVLWTYSWHEWGINGCALSLGIEH